MSKLKAILDDARIIQTETKEVFIKTLFKNTMLATWLELEKELKTKNIPLHKFSERLRDKVDEL